jgi:hypothetical protein
MSKSYKKNKSEYTKESAIDAEKKRYKKLIKQFKGEKLYQRDILYFEDDYV